MELFIKILIVFVYLTAFIMVCGSKAKRKQGTFCYCPKCKGELISSNSFVSDIDGIVIYKCKSCGHKSKWNFDIAPVPILLVNEANGGENHEKLQNMA